MKTKKAKYWMLEWNRGEVGGPQRKLFTDETKARAAAEIKCAKLGSQCRVYSFGNGGGFIKDETCNPKINKTITPKWSS